MKTFFIKILFIIGIVIPINAQNIPAHVPTFGDELTTTIEKNLSIEPKNFQLKTACNPFIYLSQFDLKQLVSTAKPFNDFLNNLDLTYDQQLGGLTLQIDHPNNTNVADFAIESLAKAKNLSAFVRAFTGKNLYELTEKDRDILLDYYMNHPLKKSPSISVKGKKFIKAKIAPCYASSITEFKLSQWKKTPRLIWSLNTVVNIVCDCDELQAGDLNEGSITYHAEVESLQKPKKIEFQKAALRGPVDSAAECCGMEEPDEEALEDETPSGPQEEYIPPRQTVGGSVGVGFQQNFEEVNYCITLEYLIRISNMSAHSFYAGAHASYGGFNFNDISNSVFQFGLSIQLFSQFSHYLKRVHITNGILASFLSGSQDINAINANLLGYSFILHTGLNLPINENVSIGLFIPVLSYQQLTQSDSNGQGDISSSDTTLLINKNNPLRIGIRFRL